ncbi:esterase/lipase family protein [Massilia scottii]|uniref:esterase/lipase family protein n=1 Tax=Massilia scottii TaxID=3057166 RepID=UPI002796C166|nr:MULTISPECIES: alpha/beta hydrolase [unclassified Massilia]MDQ1815940.1 alpha/beta hydrolase [Massilia sp. CCM 9210]MDQ1834129.1 alpha/beta hydrolase [Massilia sp. CCM 9029]
MRHSFRQAATSALALGLFAAGVVLSGAAMAQEPVIFVHGYSGSSSNFDAMVARFAASGYPRSKLYGFNYNSMVSSDRTSAASLNSFINSVRANNGNQPVSVIAHSNGGLVVRWQRAKLGGEAGMRRFITLGTPHKGTTSAYGCYSPACFDMRPGSSFITQLAGAGCDRSLWSANDGVILPARNAQCGVSVQTASVGHISMLTDTSVYNQVRAQLP